MMVVYLLKLYCGVTLTGVKTLSDVVNKFE